MGKPVDLKLNFLVLRSQVGNEQAFKQLYQQFSSGTLRYLQSFVNGEEAQDLNQEIWLIVYHRIASLTNADRFRTWLFQITRNKALDNFRTTKRMNEFYEVLKKDTQQTTDNEKDDFQIENNHLLKEALKEISYTHREVVILNFFEGMDYQEISLILGCSVGTVRSRIHNAKNNIKKLITAKI